MDTLTGCQVLKKDGKLKNAEDILNPKITTVIYLFTAGHVTGRDIVLKTLKKVYHESKRRGGSWEVFFVSSDKSEEAFKAEFFSDKHGNWYALPYNDPRCEELRYKYNISSLPNVVVVRTDGEVVTLNGREDLESIGINVIVTWG
ncbi:unnamed protein product [Brassicogethes aeneus]|uniref:Thioredoxin-like fold domain-containing protein n=1 Tax=Brassicogethes aeneus TaxID=1431903 RepID=A0A9P0BFU3_BRAAE|nr:unnamed protein product [Brassicogethes aeneus]